MEIFYHDVQRMVVLLYMHELWPVNSDRFDWKDHYCRVLFDRSDTRAWRDRFLIEAFATHVAKETERWRHEWDEVSEVGIRRRTGRWRFGAWEPTALRMSKTGAGWPWAFRGCGASTAATGDSRPRAVSRNRSRTGTGGVGRGARLVVWSIPAVARSIRAASLLLMG